MLLKSYGRVLNLTIKKTEDIFKNKDNIETFIKTKYESRGKQKVFDICNKENFDLFSKGAHEISVYLLGTSLRECIENRVTYYVKNYVAVNYEFDFEFLWSLASLYHDVVFAKEDSNVTNTKITCIEDVFECIRENGFNIEHNLYDEEKVNNYNEYVYNEELVKDYMRMRMEGHKLDHGIVAGFLLYHTLKENYNLQFRKAIEGDCAKFKTKLDETTCLVWCKDDLWAYAHIADAIVAHNIWFADFDKKETYKNFGLNYLIVENGQDNRLDIDKVPFAFYLGLIDTIEPIKYFEGKKDASGKELKAICILRNFDYNYDVENNCVKIIVNDVIKEEDFLKWYNDKIKSLEKWLKVEVSCADRAITIKFCVKLQ